MDSPAGHVIILLVCIVGCARTQYEAGCSIPLLGRTGNSGSLPSYLGSARLLVPDGTNGNYEVEVEESVTYSYPGSAGLLFPDGTTGNFEVQVGEPVTLSCEGNSLLYPDSTEAPENAVAICIGNQTFSIPNWPPHIFDISRITCRCVSRSVIKKTGNKCGRIFQYQPWQYEYTNEMDLAASEVSMEMTAKGISYLVFTACVTENIASTAYAIHSLLPDNQHSQILDPEPQYQMGPVFAGLDPEQLYSETSQRQNLDIILGNGMSSTYLKEDNILSKGQMAGKSNFVLAQQQRSTFTFANVAPVWHSISSGNWIALERSLKRRVAAVGVKATVYSGTHGVLQLNDDIDTPRDIYLEATSGMFPVPLYIYKVIVEEGTQRSTAFVIINNPHITQEEAEALTFCTDFCGDSPAFRWVEWDFDNLTSGYSFCCDVREFKNTLTSLPEIASSLFYT